MLTGQECERSRRQQALHCGHSGKSGQRGRRVATGLRGYGACEAAEGVVQKSGAKDESSRSGTLTFNGTHASERGAAARKVEWGPALREFENFVGSRFTPACNTSLTLWIPLNAAAPCWPCGRLGHVKVDEESGGRVHGFCQTQIRKQPSTQPRMHARHAADTQWCVFPHLEG